MTFILHAVDEINPIMEVSDYSYAIIQLFINLWTCYSTCHASLEHGTLACCKKNKSHPDAVLCHFCFVQYKKQNQRREAFSLK